MSAAVRATAAGIATAACSAHATGADRANITEDFIKQAPVAAQRGRLVARGGDFRNLLQTHAIDRDDIACSIEPDVKNGLRRRFGIGEGQCAHVARHIIPVLVAKLRREAGTTQRAFDRSPIVDSGLDRINQQLIHLISLMGANARAARCAQDKRAKADG